MCCDHKNALNWDARTRFSIALLARGLTRHDIVIILLLYNVAYFSRDTAFHCATEQCPESSDWGLPL